MVKIKKIIIGFCISLALIPCSTANAKVIDNITLQQQKQEVISSLSPYMQLKSKLYTVISVDQPISRMEQYKNCIKHRKDIIEGITDYNNSVIYFDDNLNEHKNKRVLYHEFGHVLDSFDMFDNCEIKQCGKFSSTKEFKDIFEEEKSDLYKYSKEKYFSDDPCEYFAESFSIYMDYPDIMKEKAPKTYAYINEKATQDYVETQTYNKYILGLKHDFFKANNLPERDKKLNELNGVCFVN